MNDGIMSRPRQKEAGFTFTELLIALAISGIMLSSMLTFCITQRKYLAAQEQVSEMLQNARAAMALIVEDVRLAGYGAPPQAQFANWITADWVSPPPSSNPQITQVGSAPVSVSIVGSVDSPDTPLATLKLASAPAGTNATILVLQSGQGGKFNPTKKKLIFIGDENAVITSIAGDTLTVTNPVTNQGLTGSYLAGTAVALVRVITYQIADNTLKRDTNTGAGSQPAAENIEDLQITKNIIGNLVTIALTARASKPDFGYKNPTQGDHYRRTTLSSEVQLKNLNP